MGRLLEKRGYLKGGNLLAEIWYYEDVSVWELTCFECVCFDRIGLSDEVVNLSICIPAGQSVCHVNIVCLLDRVCRASFINITKGLDTGKGAVRFTYR